MPLTTRHIFNNLLNKRRFATRSVSSQRRLGPSPQKNNREHSELLISILRATHGYMFGLGPSLRWDDTERVAAQAQKHVGR